MDSKDNSQEQIGNKIEANNIKPIGRNRAMRPFTSLSPALAVMGQSMTAKFAGRDA